MRPPLSSAMKKPEIHKQVTVGQNEESSKDVADTHVNQLEWPVKQFASSVFLQMMQSSESAAVVLVKQQTRIAINKIREMFKVQCST